MSGLRFVLLLFVVAVFSGCGGSSKKYTDVAPMNVKVVAKIQAGGALSSSSGRIDVYQVNRACQAEYLGSKSIGDNPVPLGLPAGQRVQLVVNFMESSFLGNSSRSSTMVALFTPRPKTNYVVEASYNGHMKDLHLFEQAGGHKREIQYQYPRDCVPR